MPPSDVVQLDDAALPRSERIGEAGEVRPAHPAQGGLGREAGTPGDGGGASHATTLQPDLRKVTR